MGFNAVQTLLEMESEITDNMTRLLAKGATESAAWQAEKLSELGMFRKMTEETVDKYLTAIRAELYNQYKNIGLNAVQDSGIPGLSDVLPEGVSSTLANTWAVWEYKTMNQLRNLGMTLIDSAQSTYIQIVYKSAAKMLAGATTLRGAIAETAEQWLDNGLTGLVSKRTLADGRVVDVNWSVEGYAQLVLRSNETQVAWASQENAFDYYDIDLVEITSHLGARPNCAPYQGRVYSRNGKTPGYPLLSSTSIGQPDGIKGCNCGHDIYPYNPKDGRTYKPYTKKENDAAYAKSQEQRLLERRIRNAKRKLSIAENISKDEKIIAKAKKKISDTQRDMRDFINQTGRTRRRDREQIY